jgi:hypothetical protein
MRSRAILVSVAVLASPAALAQEPEGQQTLTVPPPGVDLTGYWRLDPDLSDDADLKARGGIRGQQGDGAPRRPPVVPPGPGGVPWDREEGRVPTGPGVDIMTPGVTGTDGTGDPFQRRGSSRSSSSQARAASEYVRDLPETLMIAQRPSLILIQEDDDEARTRALRPDGARHRGPDGKSEHRTRWESGVLRVETWHDDGVHVEEIFELAPDGALLTVTVRVTDGGTPLSLERIFRPEEPEVSRSETRRPSRAALGQPT